MKAILGDKGLTPSCDQFYRLPDDNSKVAQRCTEWVGTLIDDGPVYLLSPFGLAREALFHFARAAKGRGFQYYACDTFNWKAWQTQAQGRWKIYVR